MIRLWTRFAPWSAGPLHAQVADLIRHKVDDFKEVLCSTHMSADSCASLMLKLLQWW